MEAPVSLLLRLSVCLSGPKLQLLSKSRVFPSEQRSSKRSISLQTRRSDRCGGKGPQEAGLTIPIKYFTFLYFHGNPQGQDLTRAISRQEVTARLGDEECEVKTLDNTHLYCEPPEIQPTSVDGGSELPSLKVRTSTRSLRT